MAKLVPVVVLLFAVFFSFNPVYAFVRPLPPTTPKPPQAPQAPEPPPLPEFPQKSGVYKDPEKPRLLTRVYVHGQQAANAAPVTNCSDPDSESQVGLTGERLPTGVWNYQLNTRSVPSSVDSSSFANFAGKVFDTYSQSQASVKFSRGVDAYVNRARFDGRNVVAWGRTSPSALGVTYYWYYPSTGWIVETDTILNVRVPWSWTDPTQYACSQNANAYDAQNILTHEIGHWLGLDDEYEVTFVDNTMYGYGAKGELKKNTLTTGDLLGITAIYQFPQ